MAKTRSSGYRTPHIDPIVANKLQQLAANWTQGSQGGPTNRGSFFRGFEDPRRDLNRDCGYPTTPLLNPDRYRTLYDEDPIANRIVQFLPKECWKIQPMIFESEDPEVITPWEEAWDELKQTLRGEQSWFQGDLGDPIVEYWKRADILSGIGYFGVMLLGIDDGKNLDQPVEGVATLLPTSNRSLAVNVRPDGSKAIRVRNKGNPIQALENSGKYLSQRTNPGPMPGYGQIFIKKDGSGQVWYVGGDGDERGFPKLVIRTLKSIKGVTGVKYESEGFPKEEDEWAQVYPKTGETLNYRTLASQLYQRLLKQVPSRPSKELNYKIVTKNVKADDGTIETVNEKVYYETENGDEPVGGWGAFNKQAATAAKKSKGSPVYDTSTPNSPSPNGSGDIDNIGTSSDSDQENDIVGQKDAAQPNKADPANKGSIAPTSFAGAQGTDAQYVGVEFSPPEFPSDTVSPQQHKLLFIRCFDESLVQIVQYEADLRNPRFGQPVMYRITLNDPRDQHSGVGLPIATVRVHWSRLIHLADNRGSSEIFGVPRMRPNLHPILDDMKIRGASAEGYWQSGFPKTSWETHPQLGGDVIIDEAKMRYMFYQLRNTLERDSVSSGMTAKSIAPEVVDPTPHHNIQIEVICINIGTPVRVFKGSERGELASNQDDAHWNDVVAERQNNYLTPREIVPFIDRLISMGVLPEPDEGYFVEWPDLDSTTKKDKAGILLQRTQAYAAYVSGNVEAVVPIEVYMTQFDSMTDEQAMATMKAAQENVEAGLQTMPQPGELGHPATEQEPPIIPGMEDGQSEFGGDSDAAASEYSDQQPSPSEPEADDDTPSSNYPPDASNKPGAKDRSNRAQVGNTLGFNQWDA